MSRASTAGVIADAGYVGGGQDLRDPVAIVERGDQQEPLGFWRKTISAGRELTLEARS